MTIEFWQGYESEHTHERIAFTNVMTALTEKFGDSDNYIAVVFSFYCGEDLDMAVFKEDGIIVVEMKDCRDPIEGGENGDWLIQSEGAGSLPLRGGRHGNPYLQAKAYRLALKEFLDDHKEEFLPTQKALGVSFSHVSAIVAVSPDLHPNSNIRVDSRRQRWFHIVGLPDLPAHLGNVRSKQISLKPSEIQTLIEQVLRCRRYPVVSPQSLYAPTLGIEISGRRIQATSSRPSVEFEYEDPAMPQADRIRQFVLDRYIEPARLVGETKKIVRSGDVLTDMKLGARLANVVQVLNGHKLRAFCRVQLVGVWDGRNNTKWDGETKNVDLCFIYKIL